MATTFSVEVVTMGKGLKVGHFQPQNLQESSRKEAARNDKFTVFYCFVKSKSIGH